MLKNNTKKETELPLLLNQLFCTFSKEKIKYCVFGNYDMLPEFTTHDVDIWVQDFVRCDELLFKIVTDLNFEIFLKNKTVVGTNYFIKTLSGDIIHLDFMTETAWRSSITICSSENISKNIVPFKNFFVANDDLENIVHLIYPLVSFGIVKDKYREKIYQHFTNNNQGKTFLADIVGKKQAAVLIDAIEHKLWANIESQMNETRKALIKNRIVSNPFKFLVKLTSLCFSIFKRLVRPKGISVAFVGNDGCGKSTIIESVKKKLPEMSIMANNKYFYWRPYVLPEINKILPTKKRQHRPIEENELVLNKATFNKKISRLKFIYYCFDYILGGIVNRSKISRAGIHIYDRHFDDLIVYPERFGMTVSPSFVKFFRMFIPQPDIVFFLHSSMEVIKQRKHEIFDDELDRQISQYLLLGSKYNNICIINGENSIEQVTEDVVAEMLKKLSMKV